MKVAYMKAWSLLVVLSVVAGVVFIVMQLHPPKRLILAAGPANGGYSQVAERYREVLARDGIELTIVETAGSSENASLLERREVDAAILQGGITVTDPDIEAIGALFYEPMVFLIRNDLDISGNPALWRGLRISSGRPGSGTAAAFGGFQAAVQLAPEDNIQMSLSYGEAVAALARGAIDIAVFVAPIDAPYLVAAYGQPSIRLLSLDHTEAISRRLKIAGTVTVPDGAISLDPLMPPEPRQLIALEARMAIVPDLHPALINRLTMAARELHGDRGIITDPHRFPSVEGTALPVNNAARQLIQEGPSSWHDWLPYWIAAQINRFLLLLLPFVFIGLPLLQALPGLYAYVMRWRVFQHYPEIRVIEDQLGPETDDITLSQMERQLVDLDQRLGQLRLPAAYRQAAYEARMHIDLVQKRLAAIRNAPQTDRRTGEKAKHPVAG